MCLLVWLQEPGEPARCRAARSASGRLWGRPWGPKALRAGVQVEGTEVGPNLGLTTQLPASEPGGGPGPCFRHLQAQGQGTLDPKTLPCDLTKSFLPSGSQPPHHRPEAVTSEVSKRSVSFPLSPPLQAGHLSAGKAQH